MLWSFVGLGRRKDMADIHARGNPLVLILIAFILELTFLGTLALIDGRRDPLAEIGRVRTHGSHLRLRNPIARRSCPSMEFFP